MQSEQVSKERYCLVKQRTVCIINIWGYTEILPLPDSVFGEISLFYFELFWPGTHTEFVSGAEKCVMQLLNSVLISVKFILFLGFFGQTYLLN